MGYCTFELGKSLLSLLNLHGTFGHNPVCCHHCHDERTGLFHLRCLPPMVGVSLLAPDGARGEAGRRQRLHGRQRQSLVWAHAGFRRLTPADWSGTFPFWLHLISPWSNPSDAAGDDPHSTFSPFALFAFPFHSSLFCPHQQHRSLLLFLRPNTSWSWPCSSLSLPSVSSV